MLQPNLVTAEGSISSDVLSDPAYSLANGLGDVVMKWKLNNEGFPPD
jgi:hypothetical protein